MYPHVAHVVIIPSTFREEKAFKFLFAKVVKVASSPMAIAIIPQQDWSLGIIVSMLCFNSTLIAASPIPVSMWFMIHPVKSATFPAKISGDITSGHLSLTAFLARGKTFLLLSRPILNLALWTRSRPVGRNSIFWNTEAAFRPMWKSHGFLRNPLRMSRFVKESPLIFVLIALVLSRI